MEGRQNWGSCVICRNKRNIRSMGWFHHRHCLCLSLWEDNRAVDILPTIIQSCHVLFEHGSNIFYGEKFKALHKPFPILNGQGRMAMDEYAIRFFQNDLFHRIFYLLCIIGICLMIMNVDLSKSGGTCSIDPGYYYGMMIGHLITRSCLTGVYLVMMCGDPGDDIFAQFGIRSLAWIVSSVMFGLSCFWSSSTAKAYVLFGVGVGQWQTARFIS